MAAQQNTRDKPAKMSGIIHTALHETGDKAVEYKQSQIKAEWLKQGFSHVSNKKYATDKSSSRQGEHRTGGPDADAHGMNDRGTGAAGHATKKKQREKTTVTQERLECPAKDIERVEIHHKMECIAMKEH